MGISLEEGIPQEGVGPVGVVEEAAGVGEVAEAEEEGEELGDVEVIAGGAGLDEVRVDLGEVGEVGGLGEQSDGGRVRGDWRDGFELAGRNRRGKKRAMREGVWCSAGLHERRIRHA